MQRSDSDKVRKKVPGYLGRGESAGKIHTLVISCIKGDITLDEFRQRLQKQSSNVTSLQIVSANGCSHLNDVLHLPFAMIQDKEAAANKCTALLVTFLETITSELGKRFLLLQINHHGYNPLIQALLIGNADILKIYLKHLRMSLNQKKISAEDINVLLLPRTEKGKSTLHSALKSGSPEVLNAYFKFLVECREAKLITDETIIAIIKAIDRTGMNVLQQASHSGKIILLETCLSFVREQLPETGEQLLNELAMPAKPDQDIIPAQSSSEIEVSVSDISTDESMEPDFDEEEQDEYMEISREVLQETGMWQSSTYSPRLFQEPVATEVVPAPSNTLFPVR